MYPLTKLFHLWTLFLQKEFKRKKKVKTESLPTARILREKGLEEGADFPPQRVEPELPGDCFMANSYICPVLSFFWCLLSTLLPPPTTTG